MPSFRPNATPGTDARIYVDACVAIYRVEKIVPWYVAVRAALIANARSEICTSDLVRLEYRTGPKRRNDATTLASFDLFFASTTVLSIDAAVYDLATDLRAAHGLKTPDAIHLATALTHGCDEFWTNDLRLTRATSAVTFRVF